jgi:tRNA-2-methylthio-N6-dimethylallyladenosine synthase
MAKAPKKLHIKTFGCQMNVYDSERMEEALGAHGYVPTADIGAADLVILNTCHIREKAAEKVYSELGRVRAVKRQRQNQGRDTMIAVAGCVAQAEGQEILERASIVDLVVGPQSYYELPLLIGACANVDSARSLSTVPHRTSSCRCLTDP